MFVQVVEYIEYSDDDLATMNPLYAAYVAANGMRVLKGRNDLFAGWLTERRREFREDAEARRSNMDFPAWIARRFCPGRASDTA